MADAAPFMGLCNQLKKWYVITQASRQSNGVSNHLQFELFVQRLVLWRENIKPSYMTIPFERVSHDDVIKWKHFPRYWSFVPITGELPAQRPVARSVDVFFDLLLNKQLSEQSWSWWFDTLSRPLWRHCNAMMTRGLPSQSVSNAEKMSCAERFVLTCCKLTARTLSQFKRTLTPVPPSRENTKRKWVEWCPSPQLSRARMS